MPHLGAASVNRTPHTLLPARPAAVPDSTGWYSIEPQARTGKARSGPDALGLANTVDPLTFVARKPSTRYPDEHSVTTRKQHRDVRRRRLLSAGESVPVVEVFSPQRSLRLAKLPILATKERRVQSVTRKESNQLATINPVWTLSSREPELPLHELIQTVDDAVKADPMAELNQSAIARLFMDQWLCQFEADRRNFKSVAVRYEVGFEELQRRTVNLPQPNELVTSFCCKVLEDLTPHFGPYAPLFRVLSAELVQSIYASDGLPYFALVKHHKRLLLTLRKDKEWREQRNDVLADDIGNVYSMFRRFLSECTYGLSRILLHQWYSVAIVQKKNNRKYITYFSNWFTSAPRAILRKVYVAWKREVSLHKIKKLQKQMQIDHQGLTAIKRQVDDLTRQRDTAQADNLTMRSDRKQAEDWVKRLEVRIKAASTFLDTTRRREAQVCQEGQLRVEAVACLPPLVLESLLRGYHGVGFLQQQAPDNAIRVSSTLVNETCDPPAPRQRTSSVLQECIAEIGRLRSLFVLKRTSSTIQTGRSNSVVATSGRSNSVVIGTTAAENGVSPSLEEAAVVNTARPLGRRAGGDASQDEVSGRTFSKLFSSLRDQIQAPEAKVLFTPTSPFQEPQSDQHRSQHEHAQVAREYGQLLKAIHAQDEHYASHSKLFNSRMLENHEISLVPNPCRFASTDNGDLGMINGVKRLWVSNVAASKPRTPAHTSQLKRAPTRRQSILLPKDRSVLETPLLENLELLHESDFDISPLHSRGFTILFLAHLATEYGSLLFPPADMSAFTHNAYVQPLSEKDNRPEDAPSTTTEDGTQGEGKIRAILTLSPPQSSHSIVPVEPPMSNTKSAVNSSSSLRAIQPIVTAYNTWNQISQQLISAGAVQSRGLTVKTEVDLSHERSSGELREQGTLLGTRIRPMLQHQFEPLSHSLFLASARDKSGRRASFTHGDGNTYHTARIRYLTANEPDRLTQSIESIHKCVKSTSVKMQDFSVTRQQLRELRVAQWQQGSELASQFEAKPKATQMSTASSGTDHREQVYECISLTNTTMYRLFSVEEDPELELSLVRAVFEKHQRLLRQLYTPFRANIKHAMSLDDLWHLVKILRLPREIHVLPILRDEELVANGYEQLFSPEDLAELLLQLCNEQFQAQISPLSARVETFVTHHVSIALQNQSLLRVLMHHSDIKIALHSQSQTIRIIFRRYCAKERELVMPASGPVKPKPRQTGHGISKYMRMIDWQAFVQDYHLIRARFSMDQAMNVFRNVQEAPPGSDDQLELIYSEFCEALVAMATFYFPDPFIKTATKVTQFLRRYLPLSPEDAHDHA